MNPLSLLLLLLLLPADDKPTAKFPLGKETTYITEPLDKDGYLDYEAALNDRLGKGITPEKNATVLIWKALGPRPEGGKGMPAEFFKRLGMDEPPEKDDYFIGLQAYMKDRLKLAPDEFEAIFEQQSAATQRPWTAKDYPHIAAWLKDNEKPLAIVVEATKRPDYFNPLVSRRMEKGPSSLLGVLLPGVQKCRELATAFAARAMLRLGEEKFDEAWQDLLVCHRLGRLVGRGATLIEGLVGIAINQIASNADLAYIERAGLSAKQIADRLKDLQNLPPMAPLADKIDLGERFNFLDCTQMIRHGGLAALEGLSGGPAPDKRDPESEKAMARIDWEPALRSGNQWYDRMAAALRQKDRAAREKEFDKVEAELKAIKKDVMEKGNLANLLLGKDKSKEAGKTIGDVLISLLVPAIRKVQNAYDRTEQVQRNLRIAFALAAYYSDHKSYPAKLDDLAPKYLPAIPDDLFSGKPLLYRPSDKGYLFYSVGVNGKDDDGRWTDDDPPGDDIAVHMPLPERKPKK